MTPPSPGSSWASCRCFMPPLPDLTLPTGGLAAVDLGVAVSRQHADVAVKRWLTFFIPAVALGVPQLLLDPPPALTARSPAASAWGWLSSGATAPYQLPFVIFWLLTTTAHTLAAVAFSPRWGKPGLRRFLLPSWLLFVIPNLVILQPWDWDNTKWFVWWAILASILAGLVLYQLMRRGTALFAVGAGPAGLFRPLWAS